jgi:radical SAM superfamily enzyme YgiQ (UPF0313 family)
MELPERCDGDRLLKTGQLRRIIRRLRGLAARHDPATVIACAFDHRTRMLPFLYADVWMAPAGVRAIGSALLEAGFERTRIVLEQWNRNFRPSRMQLDGQVPDVFMVSSLEIHAARCKALIRDACSIEPGRRPLIIAGGPLAIYQPWQVFSDDSGDAWAADVAVTGEEYPCLQLLEVLLSERGGGEPFRQTFLRVRDAGMLDAIAGLVYARGPADGVAEQLVDTGIQRLVGSLDELPDPVAGYAILNPPSRRSTLSPRPLTAKKVSRYTPISSVLMTCGCKFGCCYCPIPAYNQHLHRVKSAPLIAEQMRRLHEAYGFRHFCGVGGNFFNSRRHAASVLEALAEMKTQGRPFSETVDWGTEATVRDTLLMAEHFPLARKAGLRALWMGVEDMTGRLIRKGQTLDNTIDLFRKLAAAGISPMPMLMHHDSQPLYTTAGQYGLLNQVSLLRKAGAVDLQVLMLTPAPGSGMYEATFASGSVVSSAAGTRVEHWMLGDNYVVASSAPGPWRKQLNIIAAYLFFYNPVRLLGALIRPKSRSRLADAGAQLIGMWGAALTIRRTLGWAIRLLVGPVVPARSVPVSRIPMRDPQGAEASHALPDPRPRGQTPGPKAMPLGRSRPQLAAARE